jgi:hypothetical protein
VEVVRLELEAAGNPAYVAVIREAAGATHALPVVFSSIGPAADHARRVAAEIADGEELFIVSRQADRERQVYSVLAPVTLKRLHHQAEVVEQPLGDS